MLCPGLIALGFAFRKNEARPAPATAPETSAPPEIENFPLKPKSSEATTEIITDQPVQSPGPAPSTSSPEPSPEPEVPADPGQAVAALGFPTEYAWDPAPAPDPAAAKMPARKAAKKAASKAAAKKTAPKAPVKKAARKSSHKPVADETDPAA